jgi:hypothetical protein
LGDCAFYLDLIAAFCAITRMKQAIREFSIVREND